jgi:predicted signal transduction protein with EAL and GGDEF domain
MLGPDAFIPLAEESGMIEVLGAWVLKQAAEQQRRWSDAGLDIGISVNVSPRQFRSDSFMSTLEELVRTGSYDAGSIELEITELVLMETQTRSTPVFAMLENWVSNLLSMILAQAILTSHIFVTIRLQASRSTSPSCRILALDVSLKA